jgi:2-oxo-4-hydroxy-4-carboxy-5-ureidoimidazoline decarboxylase
METAMNDVVRFDRARADEAAAAIRGVCASTRWIDEIVTGRTYGSLAALSSTSDAVIATLDWSDLLEALAAHPRIGARMSGHDVEAQWSRQEQAATATLSQPAEHELRAANVTYEEQFGFVFLICATGKSTEQMLADLRTRLSNSADVEHEVVRRELRDIVGLRLAKAFT